MEKQHKALQAITNKSIITIVKRDTNRKENKMYSSYDYNPPASYYEPPEPWYDKTEEKVLDDTYCAIFTYEDGNTEDEIVDESDLRAIYEAIEEYKEDGLIKIEVCEMWQEFGIYYGKCEDDYCKEEINEMYVGDVIYTEEF